MFPDDMSGVLEKVRAAREGRAAWEEECDAALRDAYKLGHPVLIAQALTVALNIRIGRLIDQYMEAVVQDQPYSVPEPVRGAIDRTFEEAERAVILSGGTESRLVLQKLKADYLAIQGDAESARQLAEETYSEAQAMELVMVAEGAQEILENRTLWMRFKENCESTRADPHDWGLAESSDEELERRARQLLDIVGSPPAHPRKLLGHLRSIRLVAQERYRWCRHLQILEDLSSTRDAAKAYSETPTRRCFCDLHEYASEVPTVDVPSLVSDFKEMHCMGCPQRQPKTR